MTTLSKNPIARLSKTLIAGATTLGLLCGTAFAQDASYRVTLDRQSKKCTVHASFSGSPNGYAFLFVGRPRQKPADTPIGRLYLEDRSTLYLGALRLNQAGKARISLTLPGTMVVALQAVMSNQRFSRFELSDCGRIQRTQRKDRRAVAGAFTFPQNGKPFIQILVEATRNENFSIKIDNKPTKISDTYGAWLAEMQAIVDYLDWIHCIDLYSGSGLDSAFWPC